MRCFNYFIASSAIIVLPVMAVPMATTTRSAGLLGVNTPAPAQLTPDPDTPLVMPDWNPNIPIPRPGPDSHMAIPMPYWDPDPRPVDPSPPAKFTPYRGKPIPTPNLEPLPYPMDPSPVPEDKQYQYKNSRQLVPGPMPSPEEEEWLDEGEYSPFMTPNIVIVDGKPEPAPPAIPESTMSALAPVQPPANRTVASREDIVSTYKGYIDNCDGCLLRGIDTLWCVCRSTKGQRDSAMKQVECEANLGRKLGNADGNLVWSSLGYRDSCRNFALRLRRYYYAECPDKDGVWKETMIDLNEHIGIYDDGKELALQLAE
ncbi:uncharacterized protein PpBr36_09830 [Pyricularia pennisetigena]|uniref:uncharacterized protein n=1 Tax=Pyricularia pennisetigena TaxID=1578925 RepID=UPI00114ECD7E|nr:uncharacterized protein PpBr36_09830 [Pyricularia pennisetigena]TLS22313.1 hypothetical protein PpBr36_09830 [Pyricularia pennisetigena]